MNPFVEALLVLVVIAVMLWRSRVLLRQMLPILANPKRFVEFLQFFWRGRKTWFGKASGQTTGREGASDAGSGVSKKKRRSSWVSFGRVLAGYGVAFLGAGLYFNEGGSKVLGIILLAAAIVITPSDW